MPILIFIFIVGVVVGALGAKVLGQRRAKNVFINPDTEEADELRELASEAVVARINTRKQRILEKAQAQGRITNDDVEDLYCISDRTASSYLSQLTDAGQLTRHGEGRGTYYTTK